MMMCFLIFKKKFYYTHSNRKSGPAYSNRSEEYSKVSFSDVTNREVRFPGDKVKLDRSYHF